jgi:UDP-N-acetylmuramate: L-alanyl-gamma-D-glutamyl-meso-diaminopimelate ligase
MQWASVKIFTGEKRRPILILRLIPWEKMTNLVYLGKNLAILIMKHLHFLGICGTFMGSLAVLARELGHQVTGSDENVYPPMSTYLEAQGIKLINGYDPTQLSTKIDLIIVGNAMRRGMPIIEAMLNQRQNFISGPEFVKQFVLPHKWTLTVTGTHGKTTTSSMLAWVLEYAGLQPGFLIGGLPENFDVSSRLGKSDFFVIEGDEYDTAFFDKRSKFVHYWPKTLILNNLELDHVDIFENLAAIQKQFHHLLRLMPSEGQVIVNREDSHLGEVIAQGIWTPEVGFGLKHGDYTLELLAKDASHFAVLHQGKKVAEINWALLGEHNALNALAVIAAAKHVGISEKVAAEALEQFKNVKRRMEVRGEVGNIKVYDDFAHHPTAIKTTLKGLRNKVGKERIFAIFEPRSNSMKLGQFQNDLCKAMQEADRIFIYEPPSLAWSTKAAFQKSLKPVDIVTDLETLADIIVKNAQKGDHLLVMSNGGFGGIHEKLLKRLRS